LSSQVLQRLKDKPHLFERFFERLMPFDHMVLIYCWIIIMLVVNFARPVAYYMDVLLFHFGAIVAVCLLAQFAGSKDNRLVIFFRLLYPAILMTFFYQFSGKMISVVVPDFFDAHIADMELALFGNNPTLWLDNHLNIVVTEILSAAYFSYYFLIPGLALVLFKAARYRELKRFITATCVTFFVSYLMFIFYPVTGPRFYFEGLYAHEIDGVFFRPMVNFVIANAAFRGGAMPSSHVAEAVLVMLFALRNYGKKAWFMIPVIIGLALGTVYGRFHFVTDAVIGAAMAPVIYWFTLKLYPTRKDFSRAWQLSDFDKKRKYVSDTL